MASMAQKHMMSQINMIPMRMWAISKLKLRLAVPPVKNVNRIKQVAK